LFLIEDAAASDAKKNAKLEDVVYSIASYGDLYINNETGIGVTVTTGGTYYQIGTTDWTVGTVKGGNYITGDTTGDLISGQSAAGTYEYSWDLGFGGDTNEIYHAALHIDGVIQSNTIQSRKLGAAPGDRGNFGADGIITLAAGEKVDLRLTAVTNGSTATVFHAQLFLKRIDK